MLKAPSSPRTSSPRGRMGWHTCRSCTALLLVGISFLYASEAALPSDKADAPIAPSDSQSSESWLQPPNSSYLSSAQDVSLHTLGMIQGDAKLINSTHRDGTSLSQVSDQDCDLPSVHRVIHKPTETCPPPHPDDIRMHSTTRKPVNGLINALQADTAARADNCHSSDGMPTCCKGAGSWSDACSRDDEATARGRSSFLAQNSYIWMCRERLLSRI